VVLKPGVGFTLVRKLLNLNSKKTPPDVVLLSRNSADTANNALDEMATTNFPSAFFSTACAMSILCIYPDSILSIFQ
jgi:hypothetical protein